MGSDQFRAIHSVFGTRHFPKLLLEVPKDQRHVAASTILFEAESQVRYPIRGCYTNIYALREEVYGKRVVVFSLNFDDDEDEASQVFPVWEGRPEKLLDLWKLFLWWWYSWCCCFRLKLQGAPWTPHAGLLLWPPCLCTDPFLGFSLLLDVFVAFLSIWSLIITTEDNVNSP